MKFIPTYKESHTKTSQQCEYCSGRIYLRYKNNEANSYKLNGKYICWDCLQKYTYKLGVTIE